MFLFLSIVIAVHGGSLVRMFGKVVLTASAVYIYVTNTIGIIIAGTVQRFNW